MPPVTLPADVLEFADLVLPEAAPINWADPRIHEHLRHLANTVASVHLSMPNWPAGKFKRPLCADLGELCWALRPVLPEGERDQWVWDILRSIAEAAGLAPTADKDGYLPGIFTTSSATPTSVAAFFMDHYHWA